MTLVLTLEGAAAGAARTAIYRLEHGRVTIGRSSECGWALPDPDKTLSRQHCLVEERGGRFFVTDTSANGLFMDGSSKPVGRDNTAEIYDGSRLELGDFSIQVRIEEDFQNRRPSQESYSRGNAGDAAGLPDFDDIFGQPEPHRDSGRRHDNGSSLLDESFVKSRPLRDAEHPAKKPVGKPATPHDHTPVEFEALDLRRRDQTSEPQKVAEPEEQRATIHQPKQSGPFFDVETPNEGPTPKPASAAPASHAIEGRFLELFLEAAGIDPRTLEGQSEDETARRLGEAFAVMAAGIASMLRNRAMIKREAGVEQTMIGGLANNPLKYSVNDQEAVEALVRHRGEGYLDPLAAAREAIGDLEQHELAVLDGMQAALTSLLRRFEPERLEQELADSSVFSTLIAGGRKAQYWELFKSRYEAIAESARRRFLGELSEDFASAYRNRTERRR